MTNGTPNSAPQGRPVVIIDTNRLVRQGLRHIVGSSFPTVEAVADVSGLAKLDPAFLTEPLVLTSEEALGGDINGFAAAAAVAAVQPRIGVLSTNPDLQKILIAFQAGVCGYLASDISPEALVHSLLLMSVGERVFPSALPAFLSASLFAAASPANGNFAARDAAALQLLSPREVEILRWLALGEPNKTIASHMSVTESTVRVHMKSILRKLEMANRTQAAIWAVRQGFMDRPEPGWNELRHPATAGATRFKPMVLASRSI